MRLYSRDFEKSLRRGVRAAVRSSPELKRDSGNGASVLRKNYNLTTVVRPLACVLAGILAGGVCNETGHIRTGLAALSLWTLTVMFYRAMNFTQCLYRDGDLTALAALPVEQSVIFQRQVQKFLRQSLYALADIVAGLAGLGWVVKFSLWQWLLVPSVAMLGWITLLGLAMFCALRIPQFVAAATGVLTMGWLGVIYLRSWWLGPLDAGADWLNLFLPTGWALAVFQPFLEPGCWFNLGLLIPMGLVWWKAKDMVERVRRSYLFIEVPQAEAADQWPGEEPPKEDMVAGQQPKRFGDSAIEGLITTRIFLAVPAWEKRGWMERWLWRWLSPREKAVLEVAFPGGIRLTQRWKLTFNLLAALLVLGLAVGLVSPVLKIWIMSAGIFISFVMILNALADTGQIFQPRACSGVNVPFYAMQGLGFREVARVFSKCAAVQLPGVVVWSVVCGLAAAYLIGLTPVAGILHGLRLGGMLFAGRLVLLVFNFSGGSNDSAGLKFRTLFLFANVAGFGGLFLILGMIGLLLEKHGLAFCLTLASMFCAWAMFRIYGWFYHRNRFDLMSVPRN
jgi:hypothetical protein